MRRLPGFVSPIGIAIAGVALAALIVWVVLQGPGLFSPGPLNAATRAEALGGVASHAELADDCGACHPAPWSGETMADRCDACHRDISAQLQDRKGLHGGMLGATSTPTCTGCHTEHRGADAPLTTIDGRKFPHDLTGYSLRGHERTAEGAAFTCKDCHGQDFTRFDQTVCITCHTKLDADFTRQHVTDYGRQCLDCHDGVDRYGSDFDHNKLAYPLTGKHANVPCAECHKDASTAQALQRTPQDCVSCHKGDDPHNGSFGRQCDQCHNTTSWPDAHFDHAVFPVDHGQEAEKSTCRTCHPKDVSSYTCYGCHEHTPAGVLAEHEGRPLSELKDCIQCHEGGRGEGD